MRHLEIKAWGLENTIHRSSSAFLIGNDNIQTLLLNTFFSLSQISFSEASEEFWIKDGKASDLLLGSNHDLWYKVYNSTGRLFWIMLCKEVAYVVCGTALLPGNEPKHSARAAIKVCQRTYRQALPNFIKQKRYCRNQAHISDFSVLMDKVPCGC